MEYTYISIGGWCGTRIALDKAKIVDEKYNIFDHIRSSSKGILEVISNDFKTFLPFNKKRDSRFSSYEVKPFISEYFSFFHQDITNNKIIDSYKRKIERFNNKLSGINPVIFIRTCVIPDYNEEIEDMKIFIELIKNKYPDLKFIVLFIIPDQNNTDYYKSINNNLFIFTLNDKPYENEYLGCQYLPIFNFIQCNNLFEDIPDDNLKIIIKKQTHRLCKADGIYVCKYYENTYLD